jgi:hypothetical protein
MKKKEHLTLEGIQKIVNLKASLNKGLSDELKVAFPKTIPMQRPLVVDQVIKDPRWLAGFTTAEGCFYINIYKSKTTKLGEAIKLCFNLTQHSRDEELIRNIVEYLGCGNVYLHKELVSIEIYKINDLNLKVLPLFEKYPILGAKLLDFHGFKQVAELMENKAHLTKEGLDKIRQIKAGMNRGR